MERLQSYILESTGDMTDRKEEIENLLLKNGTVILGNGDFYVSGVKMPEKTTLLGLGEGSRLVLCPFVEEGAAVSLSAFCRISDLSLTGSAEPFERPTSLGKRHGVSFVGTEKRRCAPAAPRLSSRPSYYQFYRRRSLLCRHGCKFRARLGGERCAHHLLRSGDLDPVFQ